MNVLRKLKRIPSWEVDKKSPVEEKDLSNRLQEYGTLPFEEFAQQYHRQVFHMAYRLTQNRADAEDITQEVFFKALGSLHSLRRASSVKTWLFRIATHISVDRWRKIQLPQNLPAPSFERYGPLARLEQKELQDLLREAIFQLPEKQRATLVLRIFHDLSFREIGEVMGSPIGTVKANYHHAIVRLRSILGTSLPSH